MFGNNFGDDNLGVFACDRSASAQGSPAPSLGPQQLLELTSLRGTGGDSPTGTGCPAAQGCLEPRNIRSYRPCSVSLVGELLQLVKPGNSLHSSGLIASDSGSVLFWELGQSV